MASNGENKQGDRVAIVTGANTGIGKVTALELARKGYHVILACRSENKTTPVIEEIKKQTGNNNVDFLQLDLGSLKSVRAAAQAFLARGLPLQLLVNNAGLINGDGNTADGFQLVFGTNHLGPFLFTVLLLPRLKESKPSRIVHVSSEAHYTKQKPNWDEIKNPPATGYMGQWAHYEFSKLCNVAFSNDLAKKLAGTGVTSNSLHPGRVNTDVSRNIPGFIRWIIKPFFLSPEDGAKCSLFVATDPSLNEVSGKYFDNSKIQAEHPNANDPTFVKDLWERSVEWSGLTADELGASGL